MTASLDVSSHSPNARFYAGVGYVALALLADCVLLFSPGKHGNPSMWHDLRSASITGSATFTVAVLLLIGLPVLMYVLCQRFVLASYPSDQRLHCDRSTLALSKVRWLDFQKKRWKTRSYALEDVSQISYRRIASLRGTSIYGLQVIANNNRETMFPGLDRRNAKRMLRALKAIGVNVSDF